MSLVKQVKVSSFFFTFFKKIYDASLNFSFSSNGTFVNGDKIGMSCLASLFLSKEKYIFSYKLFITS